MLPFCGYIYAGSNSERCPMRTADSNPAAWTALLPLIARQVAEDMIAAQQAATDSDKRLEPSPAPALASREKQPSQSV
jgi:hypothetical protein